MIRDPFEALQTYFGHRRFLEGQGAVISALLQGRNALVIMPTGGGKSLCYQLPALMMDGITVVISPLIALMKDQVDALQRRGIPATVINSTLSPSEQRSRIDALRRGEFKLVYIAPERFRHDAFVSALRAVEIGLFAIDEAHCISQWGHDFRPDYMRLGKTLEMLGRPQTVALTATATPVVRHDILNQLKLDNPFECVFGFARPNLSLNVTETAKVAEKYDRIEKVIKEYKTGVIYCSTRTKVEEVTETLLAWKVSCVAYHGGMKEDERARAQNLFISRSRDVVVATNAFGMGIDRSDVRFVIHFDMPGSLEAYYQEAGRAGRDGEPGWCELLFNYADTRTQEFFIEGANPGQGTVQDLYTWLCQQSDSEHKTLSSIEQMAKGLELKNDMAVSSSLSILVRNGYLERFDVPGYRIRGTRILQPGVSSAKLAIDWAALREKENRDRDKLRCVVDFGYSTECRQKYILDYFGEADSVECGTCDACAKKGKLRKIRPATAEEVLIVRKALSGVARTSIQGPLGLTGQFGRARLIGMLLGSKNREVIEAKLDELSTYGILSEHPSAYLQILFREMENAGLLATQPGTPPVLTITAEGIAVMKSGGECSWRWPGENSQPIAAKPVHKLKEMEAEISQIGFDEALFERLKRRRIILAKASGVAAFKVFSNKTLEALTRLKPKTREAALRVHGISARTDPAHLDAILVEIRKAK
jgi:ATP-dependent DNA helicase RecQ